MIILALCRGLFNQGGYQGRLPWPSIGASSRPPVVPNDVRSSPGPLYQTPSMLTVVGTTPTRALPVFLKWTMNEGPRRGYGPIWYQIHAAEAARPGEDRVHRDRFASSKTPSTSRPSCPSTIFGIHVFDGCTLTRRSPETSTTSY
jgi:hypothetical protein